ncbi:hypothetical protein GOQ29_06290 [Clostridium sp. D2Q-14]|uniref:hypothetical protein n=1 Tax=Anaeromonas gelatinilytica TaxID=2683194 RepID=UPI00193C77DB|nr:hypothetical protein [Anaeromonas gelatinilytica]MBS4535226.1 hypothetical protein [Anaeromonas gelatinilytica]
MSNMANRDQLKNIAERCSEHRFEENSSLRSDVKSMGETVISCENCVHFNSEHKCDLNLIDKILSNMDIKLD